MGEERPWEKSYPPGVRWDAPIEMAPLPVLFDAFTERWGPKPALEYRDHTTTYADLREAVDAIASGLMRSGRGARDHRCALSAQHALSPDHVLCRAQVRRAAGASFSARCGARAGLQAPGLRRAHPGHDQHRLHGADGAEAESRRAGGSSDRRRRYGVRPVGHAHDSHRRQYADRALRQAARGRRQEAAAAMASVGVDDIALLQYTGGTTGKPKGAMLTHGNLSAACSIYKVWGDPQRIYAPGEDKIICVLPLFHIYALTSVMLRGLGEGQRAAAAPSLRRRDHAQRHRGEEGDRVPRRADHVDRARQYAGHRQARFFLAALRGFGRRGAAGGGGRALREAHRPAPRRRLGHDGDSPAGTGLPRDWTGKAGSVGLPLPGITMDIVALDDPRRRLKPGEKGEIRIKGPNVTKGYWNAPEETARRSSTATCSPATSATWTRTATSISSTARRT